MKRSTIAVDFDGVIHSYKSGWQGRSKIPDPPVEGAIEWLWQLVQCYNVAIVSSRASTFWSRWAMRRWLRRHSGNLYYETPGGVGIESVRITNRKVPAIVYLDDRALRFEGTFPQIADLERLRKTWQHR